MKISLIGDRYFKVINFSPLGITKDLVLLFALMAGVWQATHVVPEPELPEPLPQKQKDTKGQQ